MAKERVNNPKTHTDMRIRQRSTKNGKKGQFMGTWSFTEPSEAIFLRRLSYLFFVWLKTVIESPSLAFITGEKRAPVML